MVNQQLSDYIRQQLQQGKGKDEIKNELLGVGWPEADVNQALGISGSSQPPRPPSLSDHSFTPTSLQQLDPKAIWVFFFKWLLIFFIIIWMLGFRILVAFFEWFLWLAVLATLLAVVLAYIWARLTYYFYHYELTEEGFRKDFGVVIKKYTTIPYERIQNINIHRNVLDRILGLSSLKIFTAGTGGQGQSGAEGFLPGLSKDTAEELRNQLIHLSRQNKGQGF